MTGRLSTIAVFFILFAWLPVRSLAMDQNAISDPRHREQLDQTLQNSKKLEEKNLNRFAMEVLYQYSKAYDTMAAAEKADTLAKIASGFSNDTRSKRALSDSLDIQVKNMEVEKNGLSKKFMDLFRKGSISLVLWLILVSAILFVRIKAMRKNKLLQSESEEALANYEALFSKGESLLQLSAAMMPVAEPLSITTQSLAGAQEKIRQQVKTGEVDAAETKELQSRLGEIINLAEKQDNILKAAKLQREPETETRVETDINQLCKAVLDMAAAGMTTDEFTCKVSVDFEKRLPKIKVFPQSIGNLLDNLFANSFQSMKDKAVTEGKLYSPALAISTRVLPRFIQIRIKDNGGGIADPELLNVFQYYYSLNPPGKGAGLGLAEANRIMKEIHNGEITIESDRTRGTDVYLKFFTSNDKT